MPILKEFFVGDKKDAEASQQSIVRGQDQVELLRSLNTSEPLSSRQLIQGAFKVLINPMLDRETLCYLKGMVDGIAENSEERILLLKIIDQRLEQRF